MKVLEVCQEYPNKYYPQFGTFIKQSIDSIADENVALTVVSPKPMTLPFPIFPYHNFYRLPIRESTSRYEIHYPRYLYCVPKKYFYSCTGQSYSHFISNYVNKNIKSRYDLIHAHFSYPDGYGMIKLASKWKVPLVISALGTIERKVAFEGTKASRMIIESLNFADRILSVSDDLKTSMVNLGIDETKIQVVPNGVDTNRFKPTEKKNARIKLKLPAEKKIVLYIGSLREIKGVDYLVESASKFLDGSTILLLIGRDDGLKKKLVKIAKQLSILE
ncbi:glycosyltransferase, partial [bacterium]|nr:glycosyltransferase [bacterium]